MKFSLAAAVTALFASTAIAVDVDPIIIKGSKFFYKTNGTQFYMRGIAYQAEINSNSSQTTALKYTDPLASNTCKRDIPYLSKLRTNTIRVYAIDPTKNHDDCMNALAAAGIYVVADLSEPGLSINRDSPEWNVPLYERYTSVVDVMAKYSNTLGFFAGNEVSNAKNNTGASAFVKAAVRDTKSYIKAKNYRTIGVGYATNDDADIREAMANYFDCGNRDEAIDFWGYNIYSWCGDSSYTESGFDVRTKEFSKYDVPVFFAEYGCNTPRPRPFTEVGALYGSQMTGVWSGGIVYMYFEEANQYGLVTVEGNKVTTNKDFENLSKAIAKVSPTAINAGSYNPTNTAPAACPKIDEAWGAVASPLPPVVNADLCNCMETSLACAVSDSVDEADYGSLFGTVCGFKNGQYCAGVSKNATTGAYGQYGMCSAKQQLGYALNAYYVGLKKAKDACGFQGSATLRSTTSAVASCASMVSSADQQATAFGAVSGALASATGASPTGAAAAVSVSHVQVGAWGLAIYTLFAVSSGMAMIWL